MTDWVSRYVGIPFKEDGLNRDGCHCWGLVRLVYKEQLGIELPAYAEQSARDLIAASRHFRTGSHSAPWSKVVEGHQPFDVVLMTAMTDGSVRRRVPGHCGVLVDSKTVLHVWAATHAVQMPVEHPRIRYKIVGYYRHNDITESLCRGERKPV